MSDQEQSTAFADWTDDGIYAPRTFPLFDPADRSILSRAGAILATQAVSGDTAYDPVVDLPPGGRRPGRAVPGDFPGLDQMRHRPG